MGLSTDYAGLRLLDLIPLLLTVKSLTKIGNILNTMNTKGVMYWV
jgi:hypothetical protein